MMSVRHVAGVDIELQVSVRAKRATLRVIPGRGVVVSVPRRFSRADLNALITRNRQWIDATLAEIDAQTPPALRQWPPEQLILKAIGVTMTLVYQSSPVIEQYGDSASHVYRAVTSPIDDKTAVVREIAAHLKTLATCYLPPLLASHAHLHGLSYRKVSIRGQRTLWGSYSSSGTLSLNYKLLFLSRELVDYVLAHELAHTEHLNHSDAFWHRLCQMNVNARMLDRRLRLAARDVPPWFEKI